MSRAVRRAATLRIAPTGEDFYAATGEVNIKLEDEGGHSDQEEDCMNILTNAVLCRKREIKERRRASDSASASAANHHPPPPPPLVQHTPPPAHRALPKRPATGPPPGFTGVRQPSQKQHQAQTPQKQDHQVRHHGPAPVTPNARRRAPAAAGAPTTPPVDASSSSPPLHKMPTVNPYAAFMCRICGVRCMSAFNLAQHEMGRKHRNKVAVAAGEMSVQCEVCDVYISGELNVREHNAGKQHLRQVFLSELNGATGK